MDPRLLQYYEDELALPFARLLRFRPIQRINPDARMGVTDAERLVLALEVLDDPRHHDMLQHIRVVSGMKGVAIVHVG